MNIIISALQDANKIMLEEALSHWAIGNKWINKVKQNEKRIIELLEKNDELFKKDS